MSLNNAVLRAHLTQARRRAELPRPEVRRALREAAGLTQEQAAEAVGVHRVSFGRWELGTRTPRADDLDAYVELLTRLADPHEEETDQ